MTDTRQSHKPIPKLIAELNRHLQGWANYFTYGYPRDAFRAINWHVGQRLFRHLNRCSQRAFRLPEKTTYYKHFQRLGLEALMNPLRGSLTKVFRRAGCGKPHVRFDEGPVSRSLCCSPPYSTG